MNRKAELALKSKFYHCFLSLVIFIGFSSFPNPVSSQNAKENQKEKEIIPILECVEEKYQFLFMAKNVGEIDMYFVEKRANAAANKARIYESKSSQKVGTG